MQKLLRLCLRQVALIISIASILTSSILTVSVWSISLSVFAQEAFAQERGIRMRGPKSSDVFPYERYGPLTQRDTLWKIALTVRPDSRLSVYQVMQALYQANPSAFVDGNFNHLIEGQYLKIPSFERMMSVNSNAAQKKSKDDNTAWQKKQPKKIEKNSAPVQPSINKKDLDTVKVEINDQLEKIDHKQQERLESIQNDVLDSIDGLQAILKENETLRQRLSSFNSQLGTMQKEVAKSKEIKLQMDDMIKLQQALLAKAQAREQELLLEKQQAELEKENIFSSQWFIGLMMTLPAILLLIMFALIFKRRKAATASSEEVTESSSKKKSKEKSEVITEQEVEAPEEEELSLDDDLSIDLLEDDDDVIHLDGDDDEALDDLDDLDDLEDILLDDSISESEELEGGELGQDALDSLLMEDDELEEDEALADNQLDQNDLDDLLGDLDDLDLDDDSLEDLEDKSTEEDKAAEDKAAEDTQAEVTDPDDIDALLDAVDEAETEAKTEPEPVVEDMQADVTDPDDIDALLESMGVDEPVSAPEPKPEPVAEDMQADVTDPDDIDALLESMGVDEPVSAPEPELEPVAEDMQADVTDPDDIDALLESMGVDEADTEAKAEPEPEAEDTQAEVTDPDDIDALLESMGVDEPVSAPEPELEPVAEDMQADVTDPDDIDALLESMGVDEPVSASEPKLDPEAEDMQADVTDPDDIDALLDAIGVDEAETETETEPEPAAEDTKKTEVSENIAKIERLTEAYVAPLLSADFSDILAKSSPEEPEEVTEPDAITEPEAIQINNDVVDDFDIDDLIDNVAQQSEDLPEKDETLDIGDDLISDSFDEETLAELLNDKEPEHAIELSPDFSDQNVLASLLNDSDEESDNHISEASEINDIQELDNLDFDELLANIEEESSVASQPVDFNQNHDVGEEITLADFDNFNTTPSVQDSDENNADVKREENFVSVDSLLSASQYEVSTSEPYEKANIDVGLNEFPEFTADVNQIDVDIDENGIAAKIDLAKVYLEIGDEDNAQAILKEVLKLGDTQQQVQAQDMLDNI